MDSEEKQNAEDRWMLTGKVISGAGKAEFFTQLDWVQEQCLSKLGFRPYPGTLNLEICEADLPVIEALKNVEGITLIPPNPQFCMARTFPVSVATVYGAIIVPSEDVNIHGKTIVEVMAPLRLKDALGIADGDSVVLLVYGRPSSKRKA
jgi:CTP-dependent riboflavin kinase